MCPDFTTKDLERWDNRIVQNGVLELHMEIVMPIKGAGSGTSQGKYPESS